MVNEHGLSYEAYSLKKHYKTNKEYRDPISR